MNAYHVTFTRKVTRILKHGILTFQSTNWITWDGARYGDGSIHAFEKEEDALRWAAKMDWDHHKATGTSKISVVTFECDREVWQQDHADPLSQAGRRGLWLKSRRSVAPESIVGAYKVDREKLRSLVLA